MAVTSDSTYCNVSYPVLLSAAPWGKALPTHACALDRLQSLSGDSWKYNIWHGRSSWLTYAMLLYVVTRAY